MDRYAHPKAALASVASQTGNRSVRVLPSDAIAAAERILTAADAASKMETIDLWIEMRVWVSDTYLPPGRITPSQPRICSRALY